MSAIVPLEQKHVDAIGQQLPVTCMGIAVTQGERVLGIACYHPEQSVLVLHAYFAPDVLDEMRPHRRALVHAWRKVLADMQKWRMPIWTIRDCDIAKSATLLDHLGFKPANDREMYAWHGSR